MQQVAKEGADPAWEAGPEALMVGTGASTHQSWLTAGIISEHSSKMERHEKNSEGLSGNSKKTRQESSNLSFFKT